MFVTKYMSNYETRYIIFWEVIVVEIEMKWNNELQKIPQSHGPKQAQTKRKRSLEGLQFA